MIFLWITCLDLGFLFFYVKVSLKKALSFLFIYTGLEKCQTATQRPGGNVGGDGPSGKIHLTGDSR